MQIPSPSEEVPDTSFVIEILWKKGCSIFDCSYITFPSSTIVHCRRQAPCRINVVCYPAWLFWELKIIWASPVLDLQLNHEQHWNGFSNLITWKLILSDLDDLNTSEFSRYTCYTGSFPILACGITFLILALFTLNDIGYTRQLIQLTHKWSKTNATFFFSFYRQYGVLSCYFTCAFLAAFNSAA